MRPNTASIAEMVSAAVFPVSRVASVTRDLRSCKTSTGRVHLQMMRSPSQWPASPRLSMITIRDGERDGGQLVVCSPGHYDDEITRRFCHGDLPQGNFCWLLRRLRR